MRTRKDMDLGNNELLQTIFLVLLETVQKDPKRAIIMLQALSWAANPTGGYSDYMKQFERSAA